MPWPPRLSCARPGMERIGIIIPGLRSGRVPWDSPVPEGSLARMPSMRVARIGSNPALASSIDPLRQGPIVLPFCLRCLPCRRRFLWMALEIFIVALHQFTLRSIFKRSNAFSHRSFMRSALA